MLPSFQSPINIKILKKVRLRANDRLVQPVLKHTRSSHTAKFNTPSFIFRGYQLVIKNSKLKSTSLDWRDVFLRHTGPCVTLKVQAQANNIVKPISGQIKNIASLQDNFVSLRQHEFRIFLQIGIAPIDCGMPCRRMTLRQQS